MLCSLSVAQAWKLHKKLQKVKGKGIALRNAAYGYCICGAAVITYDATRSPISFGLGGATTDFFCAAYQGFDHVVNSVEKGFLLYFVFQKSVLRHRAVPHTADLLLPRRVWPKEAPAYSVVGGATSVR